MYDNQLASDYKADVFRSSTNFTDLQKIISCYYEMYSKTYSYIGPWIAKQRGKTFFPPSKEQLKEALGKDRPQISFKARSNFLNAVIDFLAETKGNKTLISPNICSHHSAQFPSGTFSIEEVTEHPVLIDDSKQRKPVNKLFKIEFNGSELPVYVENLSVPIPQIKFIILRPKLGKLGTPSTTKWEILIFKQDRGYLINHVDSFINPSYAGKF